MTETHKVRFDSFLLRLIADRRNKKVELLLDEDQVYASDTYGTLLHYAVTYDNRTIAQRLIDMGSAIDTLGLDGKTPLMLAVEARSPAMIEILLKAGANIHIADDNGKTALRMAFDLEVCHDPMYGVFLQFIRAEASTYEQYVEKLIVAGCTLHDVVMIGKCRLFEAMLQRGIDVNLRNNYGETALHYAVDRDEFEMAKMLIENHAEVNARDTYKWDPLRSALASKNVRMTELLLEEGADPNFKDSDDTVTLQFVYRNDFKKNENIEQLDDCVALLLRYGSVLPKPQLDFETVLDMALREKGPKGPGYLIAQLAIQGMIGTLTKESIDYYMDVEDELKVAELEENYKRCQRALKIEIIDKLTLLDLLNENENKMRLRARNEIFFSKLKEVCLENGLNELCPFYYETLMKRMDKAVRTVELEEKAVSVICEAFQTNENACYLAARQIFSYLTERELERLCDVCCEDSNYKVGGKVLDDFYENDAQIK